MLKFDQTLIQHVNIQGQSKCINRKILKMNFDLPLNSTLGGGGRYFLGVINIGSCPQRSLFQSFTAHDHNAKLSKEY